MQKHILGFPRIGKDRELKKALETYWKGQSSLYDLRTETAKLRKDHWQIQKDAGLTYVSTGDFSFYDHILDITSMAGLVPERFKHFKSEPELDLYFKMARGDSASGIPAMEMTKWFNTNYHYIVPEISSSTAPSLSCKRLINQTREALGEGFSPKPVLTGPLTYLSLSKGINGFNRWNILDNLTDVYAEVIRELSRLCSWIQIDEPVLCTKMDPQAIEAFVPVYKKLNTATGDCSLLLAAYFDTVDDNLELALGSGCGGIHLDMTKGPFQAGRLLEMLPDNMTLSAGIVDGRNIWKNDLTKSFAALEQIKDKIGEDRMMVGSGCSLMHVPVDISPESLGDNGLKSWMSFAVQKCDEIVIIGDMLEGKNRMAEVEVNRKIISNRENNPMIRDPKVRERQAGVTEEMLQRKSPYGKRSKAQKDLNLPLFPTTTIGSFPQTQDIRKMRSGLKSGTVFYEDYRKFIEGVISDNIRRQENLNLDVLVHGEPERNDMVEYFGQRLKGFCFTRNGWVQSYGSRCVKPPIIYGDISRKCTLTTEWIKYAQSLTEKHVKGILTGPVTILCWSFVRDDMSRQDVSRQIALAIRDEVTDLEKEGVRIIQVDEAAFSEGMPVKKRDRESYLKWAAENFRLAVSGVKDSTQIHTHMCYSEFNEIINAIADMDADVISIESSRSGMELLEAFRETEYPNEIGPGIYDIHSPRVPSEKEIENLLEKALERIPKERLWINPDCGLKTRDWPETAESLLNMTKAAENLRRKYS